MQSFFGMVLMRASSCASVSLDLGASVLNLWGMYTTIKNIGHTGPLSRTHPCNSGANTARFIDVAAHFSGEKNHYTCSRVQSFALFVDFCLCGRNPQFRVKVGVILHVVQLSKSQHVIPKIFAEKMPFIAVWPAIPTCKSQVMTFLWPCFEFWENHLNFQFHFFEICVHLNCAKQRNYT